MDAELLHEEYGSEILNCLNSSQIEYTVQSNIIPFCVSWSRKVQAHQIDNGKVGKCLLCKKKLR